MKVEGPSYPLRVRAIATVLLVAVIVMALRAGFGRPAGDWDGGTLAGAAILGLSVLAAYLSILRSRTRLDDEAITERGWFSRSVRLADITEVKLLAPRWLGVPQLRVRTGGLRVTRFHLGDARLVEAMRELVERGKVKAG